jgi:hypothetical protein
MRGRKHTPEAKVKMSEAMKGSNGYPVELQNVSTNEKLVFSSIRQAEKALQARTDALSYCLKINKLYKSCYVNLTLKHKKVY